MQDMAHTPHEQEQTATPAVSENSYPYGIAMTLSNDELEKLGLDCSEEECQVGNYLHIHALAEVTGFHASKDGHTLNLQITHMKVEDEGAEDDDADREMNEGRTLRASGYY